MMQVEAQKIRSELEFLVGVRLAYIFSHIINGQKAYLQLSVLLFPVLVYLHHNTASDPSPAADIMCISLMMHDCFTLQFSAVLMEMLLISQSLGFCIATVVSIACVQVSLPEAEVKAGLALQPQALEVSLVDRPLTDLLFTQFMASVSGKVHCLGKHSAINGLSCL